MKYDIQVNQGAAEWSVIRDAINAAETSGFDTAWVLDHLSSFGRSDVSMIECFTALGALAEATATIGLGSLVANAQLRNHALLAASATSVQNISGGRFTLGIGAGASPESRWGAEMHAIGITPPSGAPLRHVQMAKAVLTCRSHWAGDAPNMPRPVTQPRVIVGVNSVALAQTAVECADGINIRSDHPQLVEIINSTSEHRSTQPNWEVSVWTKWDQSLLDRAHPTVREWEALGVSRVVLVWHGAPNINEIAGVKLD